MWKSMKNVRIGWWMANVAWPTAFCFWFQIIVVLFVSRGILSQLQLYIFHFLWLLIVCIFFSAVMTPPVEVRQSYPDVDRDTWKGNYCEKCDYIKPLRFHHCRICKICVDRMDHHCPILQMCIHRGNHKFYLLFLIWPIFLAIFTICNGYEYLILVRSSFNGTRMLFEEHIMSIGVSNAVMVGFAASYLLKTQLPNALHNQTLIEEARGESDYDTGSWRQNIESIMGPLYISWLPISFKAL
ncbi:unnamed protein product [Caenorhabditis bovis]|uniref:Palmitoyltransferase n=1 Tax=Caenorhabditis bovis TaxID=2654633 RepID=A0A8S1EU70_9PELO|nr:unnamed protein product [Caenorhabditis bovis]